MLSTKRPSWRSMLRFFALGFFLKVALVSATFLFAADRLGLHAS